MSDRAVLRPLYVLFGLLIGWIALVVVLGELLPKYSGTQDVVRVIAYAVYFTAAGIVFARAVKRHQRGE